MQKDRDGRRFDENIVLNGIKRNQNEATNERISTVFIIIFETMKETMNHIAECGDLPAIRL